ncbi:hypothetical protein N7466_000011 [Penicillium verhagenii]|uniref:uncharacterized protein n=1 Tax=Penicillium verhagenii TaxID=1562060 RepID=UPI0025456CC7|nr:uncharacterized protein N7466_000011 [Penicillium verhagenii]KAJ5946996.1 hypothetical protein N7466_000011 [Penicillium verhagenii]
MAIESQPDPNPISYSISQHYHHSTHIVSCPNPQPQAIADPTPIEILQQHGLDPSTMSPRQLDLFKNADVEQRHRLIQTWQLYARSAEGSMDPTSISPEDIQMHDSKTQAEPYMMSGYQMHSEPTESTAGQSYKSATDPAYKTQHWWEMAPQTEPMESQYGAFQERSRYDTGSEFVQSSLFH